jgi:uncharacterized protein (UPF0333 family)
MNRRAQITVEALIIMGAILLILLSVSVPLAIYSGRSARDVQHASDARYVVEEIAAVANSVSNEYERRTLTLYVPGYTSAGKDVNGLPLIEKTTRITTSQDGDALVAYLTQVRRREDGSVVQNDTYNFTVELYGKGWIIMAANGSVADIVESSGAWYSINITLKNITFSREAS